MSAALSGKAAEARGALHTVAVERGRVLVNAGAATEETPPLLGTGVGAVALSEAAEVNGGLHATVVEVSRAQLERVT